MTTDTHRPITMRDLSTVQVAKKLGFGQAYLQKLIAKRAVPFPPLVKVGGLKIRLWSDRDVARLRKALAKRPRERRKA
jgi:predicted DNA-binding transcriptional regulator AlpA